MELDVLKCFVAQKERSINKCDSAVMHDLSILVKSQCVDNIKTFSDLSKRLYSRIMEISDWYKRCDIVADQYFQESLKNDLRSSRALGTIMTFTGETQLPSDFRDFLANSENKSILNEFLAKSVIEEHVGNQILVVTYKDTVFSNNNTLVMDKVLKSV